MRTQQSGAVMLKFECKSQLIGLLDKNTHSGPLALVFVNNLDFSPTILLHCGPLATPSRAPQTELLCSSCPQNTYMFPRSVIQAGTRPGDGHLCGSCF